MDVDVTAPSAIGQIIRNMHEDVIKESEPEYGQLDDASREAVKRSHAKKTKLLWVEYLANRPNYHTSYS